MDGTPVGVGQVLELPDTGNDDFELVLDWKSWNAVGADTMQVTVLQFTPPCPPYG